MSAKLFALLLLVAVPCSNLFSATPVKAQISNDTTLSTQVNSGDGVNFIIDGGDIRGSNLFHSFQEFSVPTGSAAIFTNSPDIQNIISRVTGNNISQIDGLIQANGNANLILINPNGIIIGENAILNLGGSFLATTANSIKFADGTEFNAKNTTNSPLLTISTPIGLQLDRNSGSITVRGKGNSEIVPTTNFGIATTVGNTFALVGNGIEFQGGVVSAPSGRIELGSVAEGEVKLITLGLGWKLDYQTVKAFSDITLENTSSLWNPQVIDNPVAGIQLRGDTITLNNSQIASATTNIARGGDLEINAKTALNIEGKEVTVFPYASWIVSQTTAEATGDGGDIYITTPQLNIRDGGTIQTLNQGLGNGGKIVVETNILNVNDVSPFSINTTSLSQLNSRISTDNLALGKGGEVIIDAGAINLSEGGQIQTLTGFGQTGNGGNLIINATDTLTASGINLYAPRSTSGIVSLGFGEGNSGQIDITARNINLIDGALIISSVSGVGKGGDLRVTATESIIARGFNPGLPFLPGGISSLTFGAGNGGQIDVNSQFVSLRDGSVLASLVLNSLQSSESSTGNAGDIIVKATESVEAIGVSPLAPITTSNLGSFSFGAGNGGNTQIFTKRLTVADGGGVVSGVFVVPSDAGAVFFGIGTGKSGNLEIEATEYVKAIGVNPFLSSPSSIGTTTFGLGDLGDTKITTSELIVLDGAKVGSLTTGTANTGKITINADSILISGINNKGDVSSLRSSAEKSSLEFAQIFNLPDVPSGNTNELTIRARQITVNNGGEISVVHEGTGDAGILNIETDSLTLDDRGQILATTTAGTGGDINLRIANLLFVDGASQISTSSTSFGNGGNITLNSSSLVTLNNSQITANALQGNGGNIKIDTQGLFSTPNTIITATGSLGVDGAIEIDTPDIDPNNGLINLPTEVDRTERRIISGCNAEVNQLTIAGNGGLPRSPMSYSTSFDLWQDLRSGLSQNNINATDNYSNFPASTRSIPNPIEAQKLVKQENGRVFLATDSNMAMSVRVIECK
jgi:filamentous hemagglutinin family protein